MDKKRSVLFFSPYATASPLRLSQARIAAGYKEMGCEVLWCIDDENYLSSFQPVDPACADEIETRDTLFCQKLGLTPVVTSSLLSVEDKTEQLVRLKSVTSVESLNELVEMGVEVGKLGGSDALYRHKRVDLNQEILQSEMLRNILLDAILSLRAVSQIADRFLLDSTVIYSAGYPCHRAVAIWLESRGIKVFSVQGGLNYHHFHDYLRFCRADKEWTCFTENWETFRDIPSTKEEIVESAAHLSVVMTKSASHTFSSAAGFASALEVRSKLKVGSDQKIVLILTSSEDEIKAATEGLENPHYWNSLFETQIDWVKSIIDYAVDHPQVKFILRIHPRELTEPLSQMAEEWEILAERFPDNMVVNRPVDELSLYDIAKVVDLGLVCISSAGAELMLFGIPMVRYCSTVSYPDCIGYLENQSVESYFDKVSMVLENGMDMAEMSRQVRQSFRWNAVLRYNTLVRLRSQRFVWRKIVQKIRRLTGQRQWKEGALQNASIIEEIADFKVPDYEFGRLLGNNELQGQVKLSQRLARQENRAIAIALEGFIGILYPERNGGRNTERTDLLGGRLTQIAKNFFAKSEKQL